MRCSPTHLYADDVLTITMDTPHGEELAALDPKTEWYDITFRALPVAGRGPEDAPIRPQLFQHVAQIRVRARDLEGLHSRWGDEKWRPIFSVEGRYEFKLGELGGEGPPSGTTIDSCTIVYSSRNRPH